MALPLLRDSSDATALTIERLRKARGRPEDAVLRQALSCAAEIAPAVIEVVAKAADGVFLTPDQRNLFFWGIHALGGAHRTELCRPLLRLARTLDDEELDDLFGDGLADSLKRIVISVFDGDADLLFAAIAEQRDSDFARWGLFSALARLTFDGAIPRDQTLQFLDRFESGALAEPGDVAWEGWTECVVFLGLKELHGRLRQCWRDERMPEDIRTAEEWEQQIAVVAAMAPGDDGLLDREGLMPVGDPVDMLGWLLTDAEVGKRDTLPQDDPAARLLRSYEREWLQGFLTSEHALETGMTIEQVDGYFTALAICPAEVSIDEYLPPLWNYDAETEAMPAYDSDEQKQYVCDVLARYLEAAKRRISVGYAHSDYDSEAERRYWMGGVLRGMALRARSWGERTETDEQCKLFVGVMYLLAGEDLPEEQQSLARQVRVGFFDNLPQTLLNLYRSWRGPWPNEFVEP